MVAKRFDLKKYATRSLHCVSIPWMCIVKRVLWPLPVRRLLGSRLCVNYCKWSFDECTIRATNIDWSGRSYPRNNIHLKKELRLLNTESQHAEIQRESVQVIIVHFWRVNVELRRVWVQIGRIGSWFNKYWWPWMLKSSSVFSNQNGELTNVLQKLQNIVWAPEWAKS